MQGPTAGLHKKTPYVTIDLDLQKSFAMSINLGCTSLGCGVEISSAQGLELEKGLL